MDTRGADVLTELAIWEAPHTFTSEGQRRFSYGLLLAELRSIDSDEGRARLATRWGPTEVETLHTDLSPIVAPDARDTSWRSEPQGLGEFSRSLEQAATTGQHVPEGWSDPMRRFLDRVIRPDRFVWRYQRAGDQWGRVRVPHYERLLHRLAIEYDHLVTRRPLLSTCTLCGRVFVPQRPARPEKHCRANLWRESRPPVQLARCVPLDETERNREWKRRDQRYRRALARAEGNAKDPAVVAAKRALGEWVRDNPPARRGRQEQPAVGPTPIEATDLKGGRDA